MKRPILAQLFKRPHQATTWNGIPVVGRFSLRDALTLEETSEAPKHGFLFAIEDENGIVYSVDPMSISRYSSHINSLKSKKVKDVLDFHKNNPSAEIVSIVLNEGLYEVFYI